eukprot:scaffold1038_cov274-Prasinococcus_capsulatus_cf.AAC.2
MRCSADGLPRGVQEEQQLFPLIEKHLSLDSQRELLWKFFSSIPLTLLEQILPWMLASLQPPEQQEMLRHLQEAVPVRAVAVVVVVVVGGGAVVVAPRRVLSRPLSTADAPQAQDLYNTLTAIIARHGGNSGGEAGAPAPAPAALPQWVDAAIALVKVEGGALRREPGPCLGGLGGDDADVCGARRAWPAGDEMAEVMPMEELVYLHNIIRAETAELKKAAGMLASSRFAPCSSRQVHAHPPPAPRPVLSRTVPRSSGPVLFVVLAARCARNAAGERASGAISRR